MPYYLDWYTEFRGFIKTIDDIEYPDGIKDSFTVTAYGALDLLARRAIAYRGGTIRADKDADVGTVMYEYVRENAGDMGFVSYGRIVDGGYPNFATNLTTTPGITWKGSRPFKNLLSTLQDLSVTAYRDFDAHIDFSVDWTGDAAWAFNIHPNHLGTDRSVGNTNGLSAIIFSFDAGTLVKSRRFFTTHGKADTIIVLGRGSLSTQHIVYVEDANSVAVSPLGRIEAVKSASGKEFQYQWYNVGNETLANMVPRIDYEFSPAQRGDLLYGKDYFLGDIVSFSGDFGVVSKKILAVAIDASGDNEKIKFTFGDHYVKR